MHTDIRATNITWHEGHVTRPEREALLKQKGATLWFTGLSGSGKSTIAFTLEHAFVQLGHLAPRGGGTACNVFAGKRAAEPLMRSAGPRRIRPRGFAGAQSGPIFSRLPISSRRA